MLVNKLEEINKNPERVKEIMLYEQKLEDEQLKGANKKTKEFVQSLVAYYKNQGKTEKDIFSLLKKMNLPVKNDQLVRLVKKYY